MRYKLIIFDLDGTLIDSIDDLTSSVNYAMRFLHMPERTRSEVLSFAGYGNRVLMGSCVTEGSPEDVIQLASRKFHEYYSQHYADQTKPYDKITKMLKDMKHQGYRLAVVSNKADYAVQDICRKLFDGLFDEVIGDRENLQKKPSPDSINLVLNSMGIRKEDAVYVGDSEVDIQTADHAGVDCIIVDWGFRSRTVLIEAGARTIISSVEEIYALL